MGSTVHVEVSSCCYAHNASKRVRLLSTKRLFSPTFIYILFVIDVGTMAIATARSNSEANPRTGPSPLLRPRCTSKTTSAYMEGHTAGPLQDDPHFFGSNINPSRMTVDTDLWPEEGVVAKGGSGEEGDEKGMWAARGSSR